MELNTLGQNKAPFNAADSRSKARRNADGRKHEKEENHNERRK